MWKIGKVTISNPLVLAPMAGVTDRPFRILAKEQGCALVFSEMISAKGLLYGSGRMEKLLDFDQEERPFGYQLFGSDPVIMARAARILEKKGADIIDLNMGCPVPKVVKNGEGAALMRDPERAEVIMKAVVDSVSVPVTVKIRKGWDEAEKNAVEISYLAEKAGIKAITVHGRTREQLYSGAADWEIIKEVREAVGIPVIGNGDVFSPQDAGRMLEETGCSAVMVGRGALGNPWIFRSSLHFLEFGEVLTEPGIQEKILTALRHLEMMVTFKGEAVGVREMRKHAGWYLKGLPGAARFREKLNHARTKEEMVKLLQEFSSLYQKVLRE